jgi:hypothetical protein
MTCLSGIAYQSDAGSFFAMLAQLNFAEQTHQRGDSTEEWSSWNHEWSFLAMAWQDLFYHVNCRDSEVIYIFMDVPFSHISGSVLV